MRLKAILRDGIPCLATESGEIIEGSYKFSMESGTFRFQISFGSIDGIGTALPTRTVNEHPSDGLMKLAVDEGDDEPYLAFGVGILHDEDCDCCGDFMEGLCPDCCQNLCNYCEQCCTPACEAEDCDCC